MATAGGSVPKGQWGQGKQLGLDQRGHKWLQREEQRRGAAMGKSVLVRSGIGGNKLFEQLWRAACQQINGPLAARQRGPQEG